MPGSHVRRPLETVLGLVSFAFQVFSWVELMGLPEDGIGRRIRDRPRSRPTITIAIRTRGCQGWGYEEARMGGVDESDWVLSPPRFVVLRIEPDLS